MKSSKWSWDAMLVACIVFAAGFLAQSQRAAWADESPEPEGRIVELSSGASTELPKTDEATTVEQPAKPVYWIGIRGRVVDDPVLRTQFQLAEDLGVVIEEVVKDSPADKAGLRQHDIVLRANDEPVQGMEDLAQLVTTGGAKPIELQVIRLGKEETIEVVPEVRPEGMEQASTGFPGFGQGGADAFGNLMGQIPGFQGLPQGGMRMFGPGIIINGQRLDLNSLPNGVAVTIEKSGDGPAKITVKQGDKTWNIVGDDAKSLEQLPEELRGYVAQLLHGGVVGEMNFDWQKEMEQLLPNRLGQFMQAPVAPGVGAQQDPVLQRMDQLERQLKQLQKQLQDSETAK
jgi:PDZ domain